MTTELHFQNDSAYLMKEMDVFVNITSNLFKVVILILHFLFSSVVKQLQEIRRIHQAYVSAEFHDHP